jgi:hypothetical protein
VIKVRVLSGADPLNSKRQITPLHVVRIVAPLFSFTTSPSYSCTTHHFRHPCSINTTMSVFASRDPGQKVVDIGHVIVRLAYTPTCRCP